MSQKEFQRVKVIENAAGGRLSVREASCLLHLSQRQVQRLKRRYQPDSPDWVQHGNRGNSMPWAVTPAQKQLIVSLARGRYRGFNDSHLTEKLCAEEGLALSRESVRRILRAAKLASPQKRRPRQYRCRRPPRPRFGMMALTDASRHDWLQGRGPTLTLIGFQDDATGQILAAHFQLEAENTLGYLRALHALIVTHGIPLSLYRDRHSIFQRNDPHWTLAEQLAGKQSPTQLGRALEQLGISQIPAYSPQAKGRIARLALHYERVVSPDHTVTLGRHSIALPPLPGHRGYAGETVELAHQLDGTLRIYRGDSLLTALPLPLNEYAQPRPAPLTSAQKRKTPMPRIYKLGGRPALAAVT